MQGETTETETRREAWRLPGVLCTFSVWIAIGGLSNPTWAQQPSFDSESQLVAESAGSAIVGLTLDAAAIGAVDVPHVLSGDATLGQDFTATTPNPLVIGDRQSQGQLEFAIVQDVTPEAPQSILIDLDGPTPWWDPALAYRFSVDVDAAGQDRMGFIAEHAIDWTALLAALGNASAMQLDSVRIVETDANGEVVDPAVPFQFDPDAGYDALTDATGTLLLQLVGETLGSVTRTYFVYFDTTPGFLPANVADQVQFDANSSDEGQAAYEIITPNATYYYHTLGGGFSSVIDIDDNDWVGNNPVNGPTGSYRGIPNMAPSGFFHPGLDFSLSFVIDFGPLRASFESMSPDELWRVRWDVYPTHARLEVLAAPENYWFLYEGTPGGSFDPDVDFMVRSDATQLPGSFAWETDLVGEEWVYFADPDVGRSLFLHHDDDDAAVESFWSFGSDMTVFGFGRLGKGQPLTALLSGIDRHYTIGLVDETEYGVTAPLIRAATEPLSIVVGAPEDRDLQPITQHELVIVEPFVTLYGLGLGGTIELTIDGVFLVVATSLGDAPSAVAAAIAAAIEAHPTLSSAGVLVSASGTMVLASRSVSNLNVNDAGLSASPPTFPLPGLSPVGLTLLALAVLGTTHLVSGRVRRPRPS